VTTAEAPLDLESLREWAQPHLARYKLPTRLAIVPDLPLNAMGKVSKGAVKGLFAACPGSNDPGPANPSLH
jgi:non-ribosomal peptide synthetase component E (peptide arylation enzyme)